MSEILNFVFSEGIQSSCDKWVCGSVFIAGTCLRSNEFVLRQYFFFLLSYAHTFRPTHTQKQILESRFNGKSTKIIYLFFLHHQKAFRFGMELILFWFDFIDYYFIRAQPFLCACDGWIVVWSEYFYFYGRKTQCARDHIQKKLILRKLFFFGLHIKLSKLCDDNSAHTHTLLQSVGQSSSSKHTLHTFNRLLTRLFLVRMNFVIICSEMMRIF